MHEIKSLQEIPKGAKIAIATQISVARDIIAVDVTVHNLTNETMSIDRTQSFFIMPNKQIPYFDPSITTHTHTQGGSQGVSVNAGAIAGALGVGGTLGNVLSGVNVGGSKSSSNSTTTYDVDVPIIHIPPRGSASMARTFSLGSMMDVPADYHFGVCIAYSIDRLKTLDNFIASYCKTSSITVPVRREKHNYYPNEALRNIYQTKPDLFTERFYALHFYRYQYSASGYEYASWGEQPLLIDYK